MDPAARPNRSLRTVALSLMVFGALSLGCAGAPFHTTAAVAWDELEDSTFEVDVLLISNSPISRVADYRLQVRYGFGNGDGAIADPSQGQWFGQPGRPCSYVPTNPGTNGAALRESWRVPRFYAPDGSPGRGPRYRGPY